jgi:anthranilate phosphoribosyltransferase
MSAAPLLDLLLHRQDLTGEQAAGLLRELAADTLPPALAGALLVALRMKGETAAEVRGFASAMRELARPFPLPPGVVAADSVGTGGDGSGSLNISTGAALVAAACGVTMVKHGNRSVSSRSGSADVLEALGLRLPETPEAAAAQLAQAGFTFLFAPHFHPAMKHIAPVRKALGVRTVFNILGPLTNPAAPPYGLVGAFDLPTAQLMAEALAGLPIERYFVVHGEPGWDEPTPCGPFVLFDVRPGQVKRQRRDPLEYGIQRCEPAALAGGDAVHNAAALEAVLTGRDTGAYHAALVLGAGLLLEVTGRTRGLRRGIERAADALRSGDASVLLAKLRAGHAP